MIYKLEFAVFLTVNQNQQHLKVAAKVQQLVLSDLP